MNENKALIKLRKIFVHGKKDWLTEEKMVDRTNYRWRQNKETDESRLPKHGLLAKKLQLLADSC